MVGWFRKKFGHREIESCKQAVKINPDDAIAHFNLGTTYLKSGMHKEAVEALKQAIMIDPNDKVAYVNLGRAYGNLGMHKEAIEALKQIIMIDPDDAVEIAKAHHMIGVLYVISNDKTSALEHYEILKSLDPEYANELFDYINK